MKTLLRRLWPATFIDRTLLVGVLLFVVGVLGVGAVAAFAGPRQCAALGEAMERETRFAAGECLVRSRDGDWVPVKALRVDR